MGKPVIKADSISKAYQLGNFGTGTISRDLERYWARMRGKEDPFLKIGEVNDRTLKGDSDMVWSLKDINFEIEQGDAVGIIGRNGAGKSTLLKILSRITTPTTGSFSVKGRIASLLEVGTGFHPELSGRDNIYLNGAILGMRKKEITRKFDEIVDFAGVERYIDTPVKRYSSGMYVRLAFAVAAHLESEILIVDEVLAVGDAEFQKKCLGKMGEVSQGEGRTVLFVSHNMGAIKKLCHKGLLLANGISLFNGNIDKCIDLYLDQNKTQAMARFALQNSHQAEITCVNLCNRDDVAVAEITAGSQWKVQIQFSVHEYTEDLILAIGLTDMYGMALNTTWQPAISLNKGTYITTFVQDEIHYALGKYFVHASISKGRSAFRFIENAIGFDMVEGSTHLSDHILNLSYNTGAIINQMRCYTTKVDEEMV